MAHLTTKAYAEWVIDYAFTDEVGRPPDVQVGLYNDSLDAVSYTSDLPLPTEPTDGDYARQTVAFGGSDLTRRDVNDAQHLLVADQSFDTANTTGYVDSGFLAWSVQLSGDDQAQDHLMATFPLTSDGSTIDLSTRSDLGVLDAGVAYPVLQDTV